MIGRERLTAVDGGAEAGGEPLHEPLYPSRVASDGIDMAGFRPKLKRAMSQALRECGLERIEVAMRMAMALGQDNFSLASLNAYTAESNDTHDISLVRFKAFVRATGANWLWDYVLADEGMTVLVGDEARLAEIAHVQQEMEKQKTRLAKLMATPVRIVRKLRPWGK